MTKVKAARRIKSAWTQTFCLHQQKVLYGGLFDIDQSGNLYRSSRCGGCGKELGAVFIRDDGQMSGEY